MATIFVDGKPYPVKDGQNLLQACLSLGFDLPYFCWHPAMGSVGACRQCAIKQFKDEKDTKGQIVMACMTAADDGIRISIDDPEARAFRAQVIEWLMVNHPHDCPVCDEGGECHLQDMTVMTGHVYRRYRFKKRTHRNQDLGPFINHEMNRCIQCYRCVRFYRDYAGGRDFNVFGSHDHVYYGRSREGILQNEFSGNLVEICPTGVFTDKTLKKHFTRKWDLQTAPSVCGHCSLGCNTLPGERYGRLRRIRNRYHHAVNGYFLCDRGRYGYEFVNSEQRIVKPLHRIRKEDRLEPVSRKTVLETLGELLADGRRLIGIGSPRASLEANFALRTLVGPENFFAGVCERDLQLISTALDIFRQGGVRIPTVQEAAHADMVFVLGEDVPDTAPLLALNLRQLVHCKAAQAAKKVQVPEWHDSAIREVVSHDKEALFIATPYGTRLDDVARMTYRAAPEDLARIGFAVAAALDPAAPGVPDVTDSERSVVEAIVQGLKECSRALVVSGTGCGSRSVMEAAANVAGSLCSEEGPCALLYVVPECNSLGMGLMESAGGLEGAFDAVEAGAANTVVILENDLFRRTDRSRVESFLRSVPHVVTLDYLTHATTERSDIVLPAAPFAEGTGTLVSCEGRAQRFFRVYPPPEEVQESWGWLRDGMAAAGRPRALSWKHLDDLLAAMAGEMPIFENLPAAAPGAQFRMPGGKIPRQSHRYSGRTAMGANISVHEPKPPGDADSPLAFSMEGTRGSPPPALITRFWSPGWNSVQAVNKFQNEIPGPLRGGDPGRRLIDPSPESAAAYFKEIPKKTALPEGQWHLVAVYHVFGSEALSMLSPGVASRAPSPYLALCPDDAAALHVAAGDPVTVTAGPVVLQLPARLMPELAAGVAGLPAGLPDLPVMEFPTAAKIAKGEKNV